MDITSQELGDGITLVSLTGILDIKGAEAIDLHLSVLAQSRGHLILDLSGVTYMASMGLRCLVNTARLVHQRGFTLVLLSPTAGVQKVLISTGMDSVMPIHASLAEAEAGVRTPA